MTNAVPGEVTPVMNGDARNQALRIALATHPRFPVEIHQRLVLDLLYDIPTQWLSAADLIAKISERFDGVQLNTVQMRNALQALQSSGWVDAEPATRAGVAQFRLSVKGGNEWEAARGAGIALESRVKTAFMDEVGEADDAAIRNAKWAELVEALHSLLRKEAYEMARAFLDEPNLGAVAERNGQADAGEIQQWLGVFLRNADGDRRQFVGKLLNGTLALHLFRATPTADDAVKRHLQGRMYYLDTNVLYTFVAQQGELATLREDLVRVARELNLKLRVTRQTIREFQDSVRFYKGILERQAIRDTSMVRALLSPQKMETLDDFRRGFYQEFLRDPNLTVDVYALRYETIEEQLVQWGIPAPIAVPTEPEQNEAGEWTQIEDLDEYTKSFTEYLEAHPRLGNEGDPDVYAAWHDGMMVAWIQHLRGFRQVAYPVMPSQVDTWFLTRDRKVARWDREYLKAHDQGRVPRCVSLEDWLEAISVFVPSVRESEAVAGIAMRELALTCPAMPADASLKASDLEIVAQTSKVFDLHPFEAARVAADGQLAKDLARARSNEERFEAVKSGVVRLKDEEISQWKQRSRESRDAAEQASAQAELERAKRQRIAAKSKRTQELVRLLEPDATFGKLQRTRAPLAIGSAVLICFIVVVAVLVTPLALETTLNQKLVLLASGFGLALCIGLAIGGYSKRAWAAFGAASTIIGLVVTLWQVYRDAGTAPAKAGAIVVRPENAVAKPPSRPAQTTAPKVR